MIEALGRGAVALARETGGMVILGGRVLRAMIPPRPDPRQLWQCLYKMGNRSVPIVVLTALFAGGLMTLQAGAFVKKLGATSLAGWGAGYAVLRELGPILIGLMFSGRVGANTTAELATMTVTEQIDGLRALSIDPLRFLVLPRVIAMVVMLLALTILGDLIALMGAAATARVVLDIDWATMFGSFADNLAPEDFFHGVGKSAVFGFAIALASCHFGLSVKGGSPGVGRAVNAQVVASAVAIVLLDFFLTYFTS